MGWGTLHSAVTKAATVHHHIDKIRPYYEAVGEMGDANQTNGYDELRSSMDEMIAYLVAKKEKINEAEVTNDESLLKDASSQLSEFLGNRTTYWEKEVSAPSCCGMRGMRSYFLGFLFCFSFVERFSLSLFERFRGKGRWEGGGVGKGDDRECERWRRRGVYRPWWTRAGAAVAKRTFFFLTMYGEGDRLA